MRDRDIDADGLALFKAHANLVVNPNLPDRGVAVDMSWLSESISADELKKLQAAATDRPDGAAGYGIEARNLAKLHAAGVKIVLGTDGGIPWSHHVEMADMVAAGHAAADVIVAATKNSAEFLRLNDAGTVAAGKSADFLVLDANPLDDITNTRRIAGARSARRRGRSPDNPGAHEQVKLTDRSWAGVSDPARPSLPEVFLRRSSGAR